MDRAPTTEARCRIGVLWPGDPRAVVQITPEGCRLHRVFDALRDAGAAPEPVVYADEVADEIRDRLRALDGVLVWVNPIENGRDRTKLDGMLRDVAAAGVSVSAHPDVILKMGTKEVLYTTRDIGWGCDTRLYTSMDELRRELPAQLARGQVRVLKQYRGNGGNGVWKVRASSSPGRLIVRHALRGSVEEEVAVDDFLDRCAPYFASGGRMVDQTYQERLTDGMIRCYLVHDRVVGFGHQAINALYPAPPGAPARDAPQPGPRLYFPQTKPEFQSLKHRLEFEWLPAMQRLLDIDTAALPVIWDADFLLGARTPAGDDTYVLCEINVSSVFPFPDEALAPLAEAAVRGARRDRSERRRSCQ
jgi:hypothetical protein